MPISTTACRTSSNLNGLMIAVISFIHLSALSPFNRTASDTTSAYYCSRDNAASVPEFDVSMNQSLEILESHPSAPKTMQCTDLTRVFATPPYCSAGGVLHEMPRQGFTLEVV